MGAREEWTAIEMIDDALPMQYRAEKIISEMIDDALPMQYRAEKIISEMRDDAQAEVFELKAVRRHELRHLTKLCRDLEEKYNLGASIETLHLIGLAFGLFEAAIDQEIPLGKIFTTAVKLPETAARFLSMFNDAEKQRVQGQLELLRQHMQDTSKIADQKIDAIRKLDQMVQEIIQRKDRELQTIVK